MKEFNVPYPEWKNIMEETDGNRIGYAELLEYMEEMHNIYEEEKEEAEKDAENRMRDARQSASGYSGTGIPSSYTPRKRVMAQSSVE